MSKKELLNLIEKYPGWVYTYVLQYERAAFLRLIYRGADLPRIPELADLSLNESKDSYPVVIDNWSTPGFPDYRLDIPASWEGEDLPGKLQAYSGI